MKTIASVILLLAASATLAAEEAAPTKVVRFCDLRSDKLELYVADPDTNERTTVALPTILRGKGLGFSRSTVSFVRLKFNKSQTLVDDFTVVDFPEEQQEPDVYVFKEFVPAANGAPAKIKATRYERMNEIALPGAGPDADAMLQKAKSFKPDQLITIRTKGAKDKVSIIDLDVARKPIIGEFVKTGDAMVDGKKFAGVILKVNGEDKALALPPAGQKATPADTDTAGAARRMKKGVYYRLTCDSARPDVIRTVALAATAVPFSTNGLRVTVPGLTMDIYDGRYFQMRPAPISDNDRDLCAGMPNGYIGSSRVGDITFNMEDRERIAGLTREFPDRDEVNKDKRKVEQYLSKLDASKLEGEAIGAAVELSMKYRQLSVNAYDDVRRYLADRAAKVEANGREIRKNGIKRLGPQDFDDGGGTGPGTGTGPGMGTGGTGGTGTTGSGRTPRVPRTPADQ